MASSFFKNSLPAEAPAKINLYLRVLGRRADGYHELDSVMARLDLADRLRIDWTNGEEGDRLILAQSSDFSSVPDDFCGPGNLALRALSAFRDLTGWPDGAATIVLEKNIPLAAGLGGGSSDGAAVLLALNGSAPQPLPTAELARLGLSLGADLPFFLQPHSLARAQGVGEELSFQLPENFAYWPGKPLILVNPAFHLSTAKVFATLGLTNPPPNNTLVPVSEAGCNDLLHAAMSLTPALSQVLEVIEALEPKAWGLSGSGPTFWLHQPKGPLSSLKDRRWWVKDTFVRAD